MDLTQLSVEDGARLIARQYVQATAKEANSWVDTLKQVAKHPATIGAGLGTALGAGSAHTQPKGRRNYLGRMLSGAVIGGLGGQAYNMLGTAGDGFTTPNLQEVVNNQEGDVRRYEAAVNLLRNTGLDPSQLTPQSEVPGVTASLSGLIKSITEGGRDAWHNTADYLKGIAGNIMDPPQNAAQQAVDPRNYPESQRDVVRKLQALVNPTLADSAMFGGGIGTLDALRRARNTLMVTTQPWHKLMTNLEAVDDAAAKRLRGAYEYLTQGRANPNTRAQLPQLTKAPIGVQPLAPDMLPDSKLPRKVRGNVGSQALRHGQAARELKRHGTTNVLKWIADKLTTVENLLKNTDQLEVTRKLTVLDNQIKQLKHVQSQLKGIPVTPVVKIKLQTLDNRLKALASERAAQSDIVAATRRQLESAKRDLLLWQNDIVGTKPPKPPLGPATYRQVPKQIGGKATLRGLGSSAAVGAGAGAAHYGIYQLLHRLLGEPSQSSDIMRRALESAQARVQ